MNQNEMVLTHLIRVGPLTPKEAMDRYGIMRLGARIWDLKQSGHVIDRGWEEAPNRFGERTKYARYIYRGKADGMGEDLQTAWGTVTVQGLP